eukprot:TRINITY_DN73687_c0_g1_i1.p1 TRINITY_DN73687_c0_g1~~TRINITY_DN73687_c0_g1_i1.p1  ORF type:complete len:239 (-),score=35.06 TRINITY_DN73687_c0_g1_i1:400-1116(-)
MVQLPVVENKRGAPVRRSRESGPSVRTPSQLAMCFHGWPTCCSEFSSRKMRNRAVGVDDERCGVLPATVASVAGSSKEDDRDANSCPAVTMQPATFSETRSTQSFSGIEGLSLSRVGNWLDTRNFHHSLDIAGLSVRRHGDHHAVAAANQEDHGLSAGERFVLRNVRERLVRRFGTPQGAFAKLRRCHEGEQISLEKFVTATAKVLHPNEVQVVFRLLDKTHHGQLCPEDFVAALVGA